MARAFDAEAFQRAFPTLEEHRAAVAKKSLPEFVRLFWSVVEPARPLFWNWHLDELCDRLVAITNGELKQLIINVPPGCMKSLLVNVMWPAWEWASNPALRYLTAAYSSDNTIRDNLRLRDIVTSEAYRRAYGVKLASDQAAKVRFNTTAKGWRIATSIGGKGTGEHPDRVIIDDPIKATGARSAAELAECSDWFDRTITTRLAQDPAIILIMQRLNELDLAGHLLAKGGWEHVLFPMRFRHPTVEPDGRVHNGWKCPCHERTGDALDHRTKPGELLWPALWPEERVRREELGLGPYGVSGQLQQDPVPEGGGLFKRDWFEIVEPEAVPEGAQRCRGWDTAGTEDGGDWTVGVKLAESARTWYVEHAVRGQWGPAAVDKIMRQTAESDGRACAVREEKEGGSAGKAVITARAKALVGFDYAGVQISGDKITRAKPFRAQCEAGNVKLVRGEWNGAWLDVVCSFPVGPHDDDVDASSCAFNAMVEDGGPVKVKLTW